MLNLVYCNKMGPIIINYYMSAVTTCLSHKSLNGFEWEQQARNIGIKPPSTNESLSVGLGSGVMFNLPII